MRVRAVALNHLDIWVRRGGPAFKLEYPHRLGSRHRRRDRRARPGATAKVGAKVVVQPGLSCMRCAACLGGHDNLCRYYKILGENTQGGYARVHRRARGQPRAVSRAARLRARGRVDPAVPHRVADGRAQGARAARRHRARAGRGLGRRRRGDPDREAVRRARDRDRGQRRQARAREGARRRRRHQLHDAGLRRRVPRS